MAKCRGNDFTKSHSAGLPKALLELRTKLASQLESDLTVLLKSSNYCDIELVVDNESIFGHSCIFKARAARFYAFITTKCKTTTTSVVTTIIIENASFIYIRNFVENIYSSSFIPEAEFYVLKYLENLKRNILFGSRSRLNGQSNPNLLSPESETFFTPKSSPSELYKPFTLLKTSEEEISLSRIKNNASVRSYYRIVSLDNDDRTHEAQADLEKELAEQDKLFESFKCISSKKYIRNKPNSLSIGHGRKGSKGEPENKKNKLIEKPKLSGLEAHLKKSHIKDLCFKRSKILHPPLVVDTSFGFEISPDLDSGIVGVDSIVDTNTTNPMEISPKENFVSDTSGVDLTEGTVDDIPLDDTKIISQTCNIVFHDGKQNDGGSIDNVQLEENDLARLDEMEKNMTECEIFLDMERRASSSCTSYRERDILGVDTDVTPRLRRASVDSDTESMRNMKTDAFSKLNQDITAPVSLLEPVSQINQHIGVDCADLPSLNTPPCSPKVMAPCSKLAQTWEATVSNNFFIDASSLLDEDEIVASPLSLPPMKLNEVHVVEADVYNEVPGNSFISVDPVLERRQGDLIFRNSIPHYSLHQVDNPSGAEQLFESINQEDGLEQVVPESDNNELIRFVGECFRSGGDKPYPSSDFSINDLSDGFDCGRDTQTIETTLPDEEPNSAVCRIDPIKRTAPIDTPVRKVSAECVPIVSGGVSPKDYSTSPHSHSNSPHLRRRNELAPILSGGLDVVEDVKPKTEKKSQPSGEVWVVDIGPTAKKPNRFLRGTSSESESDDISRGKSKERTLPLPKAVRNLKEGDCKSLSDEETRKCSPYPVEKSASLGYFIDLGDKQEDAPVVKHKKHKNDSSNIKKNIFSMFIDFADEGSKSAETSWKPPSKVPPKEASNPEVESVSSSQTTKPSKKPFYMFIENDSLPVKKKIVPNVTQRRLFDENDRQSESQQINSHHCVNSNNSGDFENVPSTEKMSFEEDNALIDVWSNNKRELNQNENEQAQADFNVEVKNSDVILKKGSTFIIEGAVETNKKVKGPVSELHTVMESTTPRSPFKSPKSEERDSGVIATEESDDSFVRLSDMDNAGKNPYMDGNKRWKESSRMSQSIPEDSWLQRKPSRIPEREKVMSKSVTSNTQRIASIGKGVSKSLSRLFPNLSASVLSLSHKSRPESELQENEISHGSELSSMYSSIDPYGLEISTSETDVSCHADGASRLGQDLLRMFLEEISPDVIVEVGGRRLKAHKCILSSRCQYFAAMLSGGWVESAGNVISLQGFSFSAVHFALCHIYSGESEIPDTLNIIELATLADMLCLEGLKEVISYTLRVKYCHSFHPPCSGCCVGVMDCLPVAAAYGLDDLYRKCLRWTAKYFVKVWPSKAFASLPKELLDKCYQYHVVHMTVDNVLDTLLSIDKVRGSLPCIRWAETINRLTNKLQDAVVKFLADHFSSILTCDNFLTLGKDAEWSIERVEHSLVEAAGKLPPEQACWSHARLHSILSVAMSEDPPAEMVWNEHFIMLLSTLSEHVQASLIRQAPRAARSKAWQQMEPELRSRIQEAACLVLPNDTSHGPRRSSSKKDTSLNSTSTAMRNNSRAADLRQVKLTMTQQSNRTMATVRRHQQQTEKSFRPDPLRNSFHPGPRDIRKSQSTSAVRETMRTQQTTNARFTQVKSRYMEPRSPHKVAPEKTAPTNPRRNPRGLSSSDSSRNCSPGTALSQGPKSSAAAQKKSNVSSTVSCVSTRSDTPSTRGLSKLTADDNMSTDSLATESSCGEKEVRLARRLIRGKENIADRKQASDKIIPNLPRKTQSLSSFPSAGKPQNKLRTMIPRMEPEIKGAATRRVQPARSSLASPKPTQRVSSRVTTKNVNAINGNIAPKRIVVDADNNTTPAAFKQPAIVSRSGTFLKDEPTILKKPQAEHV